MTLSHTRQMHCEKLNMRVKRQLAPLGIRSYPRPAVHRSLLARSGAGNEQQTVATQDVAAQEDINDVKLQQPEQQQRPKQRRQAESTDAVATFLTRRATKSTGEMNNVARQVARWTAQNICGWERMRFLLLCGFNEAVHAAKAPRDARVTPPCALHMAS